MNRGYSKKIADGALWFSVFIYGCFMAQLLLFKYTPVTQLFSGEREPFRSVNLIPLKEIGGYLFEANVSANLALTNVLGNIVIFVPLGLLLQLLRPKQPKLRTVGIVFLISVAVESAQFILGLGSTDVDDVILNTLGGILGVFIYALLLFVLGNRERVRGLVTAMALTCAVFVAFLYGPIWVRTTFPDQYLSSLEAKYGMDLEQAHLAGVYQSLKGNFITLMAEQDGDEKKIFQVEVGDETKIAILRRDQEGEIYAFEPIDGEFLSKMQEGLPIWIQLEGDQVSEENPLARRVCIGDSP